MSRSEGSKAVKSSTFSEFMQYLVFTLRVEKSRKQAGKEPVHDATAAARTYMLLLVLHAAAAAAVTAAQPCYFCHIVASGDFALSGLSPTHVKDN